MTTITITTLQPLAATDFAAKLMTLTGIAESLFGAVDVDFVVVPTVTVATYQAAMAEFDDILAEVRAQPDMMRLSAEQLDAIEAERPGEEFCLYPFQY